MTNASNPARRRAMPARRTLVVALLAVASLSLAGTAQAATTRRSTSTSR